MPSLRDNLEQIRGRVERACAKAERAPADIRLVWVSKNQAKSKLLEALKVGADASHKIYFGENRVQEILAKFPLMEEDAEAASLHNYELHFIGHLQKNKIRKILSLVSAVHSVDSLSLLEALDRVCGELNIRRDVFLQVNTSREAQKSGFDPDSFLEALRGFPPLPHVRLVGLMTMGPASMEPDATRRCFRELSDLLRSIRDVSKTIPQLDDMRFLSMGMSGDFEIAIEEGSHFLRIGTALFGGRN